MNDAAYPDTQPFYIRFLPKLGNYLVGATLLCYLTGFAITNLYLGSLGIVNLDILRARYVLAGLLFLLFLIGIAYLVYGLIRILRKYSEKPALTLIAQVLWYSFISIGILYLAIPAIAIFAGSLGNTPVGIPQLSPVISWSDWFATVPTTVIRGVVALWGSLLSVVLILLSLPDTF